MHCKRRGHVADGRAAGNATTLRHRLFSTDMTHRRPITAPDSARAHAPGRDFIHEKDDGTKPAISDGKIDSNRFASPNQSYGFDSVKSAISYRLSANTDSKLGFRAISNRFLLRFHFHSFSASSALFRFGSNAKQIAKPNSQNSFTFTADLSPVAVQSLGCRESKRIVSNRVVVVFSVAESAITSAWGLRRWPSAIGIDPCGLNAGLTRPANHCATR